MRDMYEVHSAARRAADLLANALYADSGVSILLGVDFSEDEIGQLSNCLRAELDKAIHVFKDGPARVIFSISGRHQGVAIRAQGSRPAGPEDFGLPTCLVDAHMRAATDEEVRRCLSDNTTRE